MFCNIASAKVGGSNATVHLVFPLVKLVTPKLHLEPVHFIVAPISTDLSSCVHDTDAEYAFVSGNELLAVPSIVVAINKSSFGLVLTVPTTDILLDSSCFQHLH